MSETTDQLLDRLITLTEKHAQNVLIGLGEDLVPTWAMIDRNANLKLIPTPWGDIKDRNDVIFSLRLFMRIKKIVVYSFVTEAWLAKVSEKEWNNPMGVVPPSKRVDRQEVVIACAATADSVKWARWAIKRNNDGRVTELVSEPVKTDKSTEIESWIGGMLK